MTSPTLTIVTPSFNSARHIRETILSVISQRGDFSIEYIIVDNDSTDGTQEIVGEFQRLLNSDLFTCGCGSVVLELVKQQSTGMYGAINEGFEKATGDIYAWLNSDDIYLPGALATISSVFSKFNDIQWLKGITSYITEDPTTIWRTGHCMLYAQDWIKTGIYGRDHYFIQQDSVFWRHQLWNKVGSIDDTFRLAGDYYLWSKFSEHAPLITVNALVSCFRSVDGQLSQDFGAYENEMRMLLPGTDPLSIKARLFIKLGKPLPVFIKKYLFRALFGRQSFSVVLINAEGKIERLTGEYYEVLKHVSKKKQQI